MNNLQCAICKAPVTGAFWLSGSSAYVDLCETHYSILRDKVNEQIKLVWHEHNITRLMAEAKGES